MLTPGYAEPVPPMVNAWTFGWGTTDEAVAGAVPASATWESANRAVYYPIWVPTPCVARRVYWANGATTTGGATIEVGLYSTSGYKPGAKVVSGSATQGTASEVQFVDITDTTLTPGLWWLAVTASSTTNTTLFRGQFGSASMDELFRFDEASANPLPSTATPVESNASNLWVIGFSTTTIT